MCAPRGERDRGGDEESGQYASDHYARASWVIARGARRRPDRRALTPRGGDSAGVTEIDKGGPPLAVRGER
jgi:hypothetical protein